MDILDRTLAFTGHRPSSCGGYNENNDIARRIKLELRKAIASAMEEGFTTFISGGALGVDIWAAEIVIDMNAKLIVARPFPSQHVRWPVQSQERFFSVLNKSEVYDVSPDPYHVSKMQIRNQWMVDNSSLLIAVFNGTPGGTANCISYAKKQNKRILIIKP